MPNYVYRDTDTLKNKLDVTDFAEFEDLEGQFVVIRDAQIALGVGPTGQFDADHYKALHRFLFQDVFEWAGRTRDELVQLSDGTIATEPEMQKLGGIPFLHGSQIQSALDEVADDIRKANFLRGLRQEEFAIQAADILSRLNTIHPVREGNGRTQRRFIIQLADEAGHDLDFSVITQERMYFASVAAHEYDDFGEMQRLFKDAVIPERRAALASAIADLDKAGAPWNDLYIAAAEPGYELELKFFGVTGATFRGDDEFDAIIIGRTADLPKPRPRRGKEFILRPGSWTLG